MVRVSSSVAEPDLSCEQCGCLGRQLATVFDAARNRRFRILECVDCGGRRWGVYDPPQSPLQLPAMKA
jgi:hypothetical protein